jgi:tetratricopeptide (TPR) repeat protein
MTALEAVLFVLMVVMVLIWFGCVSSLSRQLRERHAEKYQAMSLDKMWPRDLAGWLRRHNNFGPVSALLRFLVRKEDLALQDAQICGLSAFMRRLLYVYISVFGLFLVSFFSDWDRGRKHPEAARQSSPAAERRAEAFELHNAGKWKQAIAIYDQLLGTAEADAELHYWRAMAHWQLGDSGRALDGFQRVIELEPTNFSAHRDADRILSRERRWDEIIEMWDRYIARAPSDAEAYFERGGTNFHKGDIAAARADAGRACALGKSEACAINERLKSRP